MRVLGTLSVPALPSVPTEGRAGQMAMVQSKLYQHNGLSWEPPPETLRELRLMQLLKNPGATTVTAVGMASPNFAPGPLTGRLLRNNDDATGPWLGFSTAVLAGDTYGAEHLGIFRAGWQPEVTLTVRVSSPLPSTRLWVGLVGASPSGSQPSVPMLAFRYDSTADLSGNWQTVTSTGAIHSVVDSAIPVEVDTPLRMRFHLNSQHAEFYINSRLAGRHTTALPAGDQMLGWIAQVTTLADERRTIRWGRTAIQHA